jgi:hypothetical protein
MTKAKFGCDTAAMAVLGRLGGARRPDQNVAAQASAAAHFLRAYAARVEALRRQETAARIVMVEHPHVNEAAQADRNVRPRALVVTRIIRQFLPTIIVHDRSDSVWTWCESCGAADEIFPPRES